MGCNELRDPSQVSTQLAGTRRAAQSGGTAEPLLDERITVRLKRQ
jgi:hypothetical protein